MKTAQLYNLRADVRDMTRMSRHPYNVYGQRITRYMEDTDCHMPNFMETILCLEAEKEWHEEFPNIEDPATEQTDCELRYRLDQYMVGLRDYLTEADDACAAELETAIATWNGLNSYPLPTAIATVLRVKQLRREVPETLELSTTKLDRTICTACDSDMIPFDSQGVVCEWSSPDYHRSECGSCQRASAHEDMLTERNAPSIEQYCVATRKRS
jgi:hypothetical protein